MALSIDDVVRLKEHEVEVTMKTYEYGRIAKLAESLGKAGIAQDLIEQIMEGGEAVRRSAKPEKKADWMRDAMHRMDKLLDRKTRYAVREACACCLGGKRLKTVRAIPKKHERYEDRIRAANEAKSVFGHSVVLQDDGSILVCFSPEGLPNYRCVCLPKANAPLPITYCYCCGGHVKHHLQIALDRELTVKVRSSALSSGGKKPCTFVLCRADA
jgi:hypothetical protein